MEILVNRLVKSEVSSISKLSVDGLFQCYSLEDKDRGLTSTSDITLITKLKQHAVTAIPTGRYEIAITYSNRFKKYLPLLLNVPGFAGVRIHLGNTAAHTEGCILPGESYSKDFVADSKKAFDKLFAKMKAVEKKEKIYITIQ